MYLHIMEQETDVAFYPNFYSNVHLVQVEKSQATLRLFVPIDTYLTGHNYDIIHSFGVD